jgi:hypothetical protein
LFADFVDLVWVAPLLDSPAPCQAQSQSILAGLAPLETFPATQVMANDVEVTPKAKARLSRGEG